MDRLPKQWCIRNIACKLAAGHDGPCIPFDFAKLPMIAIIELCPKHWACMKDAGHAGACDILPSNALGGDP